MTWCLVVLLACLSGQGVDREGTLGMIRALPEPFRMDLALRYGDRGGAEGQALIEELFAQRSYASAALYPVNSVARTITATPTLIAFGGGAQLDRLSLGLRAVAWMQPRSARRAREMFQQVTEDLESARWEAPDCQSYLVPMWRSYFDLVPNMVSTGFTDAERAKGEDMELGRRAVRLVRSISQLHDVLELLRREGLPVKLRTAMVDELLGRMSGWPVSGREWWALYQPLIERASMAPELGAAFRQLAERALQTPVCGEAVRGAATPQEEAVRAFAIAFAGQGVKPLSWQGKTIYQANGVIEIAEQGADYRYFLDEVRRLRGQTRDRQNEPQWRQAYRDLVSQLKGWRRGEASSLAVVAVKLSAIEALVTMPANGRGQSFLEVERGKQLEQAEEVGHSAPVSEYFAVLTSAEGKEVQAQHPGYWLMRLILFARTAQKLSPAVRERFEAAVARETHPVIQAYVRAGREGWL